MNMKFRAPTDEAVHIALLSGHSAIVTREWRELDPIFQAEALARRCEVDKGGVIAPKDVPVKAGDSAQNQVADVDQHYRNAIEQMLERNDDGDFTNDELPNIKVVSSLVGFRAVKEDVLRVFRDMVAEAQAEKAAATDAQAE